MDIHPLSIIYRHLLTGLLFLLMTFPANAGETDFGGRKVLYVASYHQGHDWTDGTTRGIRDILKHTGIELKIHYMDTKRNRNEAFLQNAAIKAKQLIEAFKPDAVIISDDNAVKYLLAPFYKDAPLPFVFSGVNWDASVYGLPYQNTTGILEVELLQPLLNQLSPYAKGDRIGYLAMDSLTSHKNLKWHQKRGVYYHKIYYVNSYEDWNRATSYEKRLICLSP